MARDVRRYFRRNAAQTSWYSEIESITVAGGVITITTSADLSEPSGRQGTGRQVTVRDEICCLIQGSAWPISRRGTRFSGATGIAPSAQRERANRRKRLTRAAEDATVADSYYGDGAGKAANERTS
jgi:hypothetical protein